MLAVTQKWHRDTLARVRTRTLRLCVSQHGYDTETQPNAICSVCKTEDSAEDTFHFIFSCKEYQILETSVIFLKSQQ